MKNCSEKIDQPVPFVDLGLQYENHHAAFEKAIIDTAASTQYIMGAEVSRFEKDFSDFLGVREVVSVASGTDALRLSCLAHDIGPADEILVPANTFIASILLSLDKSRLCTNGINGGLIEKLLFLIFKLNPKRSTKPSPT